MAEPVRRTASKNRRRPRRDSGLPTPPTPAQAIAGPDAESRTPVDGGQAGEATAPPDGHEPPDTGATFQVEENRDLIAKHEYAARWRSGKKAKEQAAKSALTLLTILDGAIGISLGAECQMTADEREMILEPMARIMARLTPETSEMIDRYTDPVLLLFGFIMWGGRVFFVLQRQANEAKPKPVNHLEPKPAPETVAYPFIPSDMPVGVPSSVAEALG